jgi:hypothetical protein
MRRKIQRDKRDSCRIGCCVNARSIPFSCTHQSGSKFRWDLIIVSSIPTQGFVLVLSFYFGLRRILGFEFCGLVILMWAPCICEASSERNRSWVCEEDTRLSSSSHFSLLMTLSFL